MIAILPRPKYIDALLQRMTLEEKASLCSGMDFWNTKPIPRFGIPSISMADGPHGLRKQKKAVNGHSISGNMPATCFPTAVTLVSTWNQELIASVGEAIGQEAKQNDVNILLGPGVNIKRAPLGGRNFEYFSEDPYLAGKMASSFISGLQSTGTGACIKHFAANNQETRRFLINAIIDEKTLHEIYLKPFEMAIKEAEPWTVMAAYNKLNGHYCCESRFLLEDTLRSDWGFDGLVMSDWGAVDDRMEAVKAGMDLEMPGYREDGERQIIKDVKEGKLSIEDLDKCTFRILELISRCKATADADHVDLRDKHRNIAEIAACEGAVLLKNEGALLPLKKKGKLAVIGEFAKKPRYQGAGSSMVTPYAIDDAYGAILATAGGELDVTYAAGYRSENLEPDAALIAEARSAASLADAVAVFCGLPAQLETEGIDRRDMRMPAAHERLIEEVLSVNRNLVVVLMNGSPLEMPWVGDVPCILEVYLGGQAGGGAIAKLLFGEVVPSGKLAETFPKKWDENPASRYFPGNREEVEYREGIYVGYRYYDAADVEVLFPFGHGLSYTDFYYEDLSVEEVQKDGLWKLYVSFMLSNKGAYQGKEVAQVYVRKLESGMEGRMKQLAAYRKVQLTPGEGRRLTLSLNQREFSSWSSENGRWVAECGKYEILLGSSSRDIRLRDVVDLKELSKPAEIGTKFPDYFKALVEGEEGRMAFADIMGSRRMLEQRGEKRPYTLDTPLCDMEGPVAALVRFLLMFALRMATFKDRHDPSLAAADRMLLEAPLHKLTFFTTGAIRRPFLKGLLSVLNFRFLKCYSKFRRCNDLRS